MPSRSDTNYFGAGPAGIPTAVLEEAARILLNYNDNGIGIAEISHRSKDAEKVLNDAKQSLRDLLDVPDDYEIMFLQSGGTGEFSAVVYHMVSIWVEKVRRACEKFWAGSPLENASEDEKFKELQNVVKKQLKMDYLVTGSWSLKASQEAARLMGSEYVNIATDSRKYNDGKFGVIAPESEWELCHTLSEAAGTTPLKPALTFYCDNETVDGVEFPGFPKVLETSHERNVIADMSSNFLSRAVDVKKFSVIFGGAQKNIGNTGIAIVIMRKNLLPPVSPLASPDLMRKLGLSVGPIALDYATVAKNNSLYNTLPILDVWVAGRVMKSLLDTYGAERIRGQEKVSDEKAQLLYSTIDSYPEIYQVVPHKSVRSRMNLCLRIKRGDDTAEKQFLSGAEELHLTGLKGHRSVGGIRISNYNAVSMDATKKLVQYLNDYAKAAVA